jgi:hypothetical protein
MFRKTRGSNILVIVRIMKKTQATRSNNEQRHLPRKRATNNNVQYPQQEKTTTMKLLNLKRESQEEKRGEIIQRGLTA